LEDVLIREGRVKPARVVKIIRQILSSLQEAHALGVLPRDIKPSNIMVYTHVGRTDLVKVLDFGIAKIVTEQNPDMTAEGSIVGTPRYIAPERLRGDELPTSDLYSVGVLAWELLTGQAALNGKAGMMALRAQLEEPSITLPTHIDVPGALRQIINKLTSKPVVQRYARAEEALDDLEYWSQDLLDNGADDSSDSLPDASASATAVLPVEQLLRANAPDTGEATLKPRVIFERPPSHDDDDDATEMTQQVEPLTFDSDFKTVPQRAITSDAYKTLPMSNVQEHALRDEALDTASRPAPSFIAPQVAPKMRADASPSTRQPTGPMYPQPRLVNTPAQFSAPAQLHTPAPFAQPQTPTPAQHINPSPQDPARSEAFIREHAPPEEKTDSEHVPLTQIMSWIFRIVMIIAMLGVCYYVSQMIQRSF
jgi:serine/threonine protein kinase